MSEEARPPDLQDLLRQLQEAAQHEGGLPAELRRRIRETPDASNAGSSDPVVVHWRNIRRRLLVALEKLSSTPNVIVTIVVAAGVRARHTVLRVRARLDEVASSLPHQVFAAGSVITVLALAGTLFAGTTTQNHSPSAAASESRSHRTFGVHHGHEPELGTRPSRSLASPGPRSSQPSTYARLDLRGAAGGANARVSEHDNRLVLTSGVDAWLAPLGPYGDRSVWISCDPASKVGSTLCATLRPALSRVPPPPYGDP